MQYNTSVYIYILCLLCKCAKARKRVLWLKMHICKIKLKRKQFELQNTKKLCKKVLHNEEMWMTCIPASLLTSVCAIYGLKFKTMPVCLSLANGNQAKTSFSATATPKLSEYFCSCIPFLISCSFGYNFSQGGLVYPGFLQNKMMKVITYSLVGLIYLNGTT